jgi:hypothetical protein
MLSLQGLNCGEAVAPPGGTCSPIGAHPAVVAGEFMQLFCNKLIANVARMLDLFLVYPVLCILSLSTECFAV